MLLNFFLTSNPYAALHTGSVDPSAATMSETWRFHVGVMIGLSCAGCWLTGRLRQLDYVPLKGLAAVAGLFLAGLDNGGLFECPLSYFMDASVFVSLAAFAGSDRGGRAEPAWVTCYWLAVWVMFAGIALALIRPLQWGNIPFGFSRETRGEVTLWEVSGINVILPVLMLLVYRRVPKGALIGVWLVLAVITASTATRAPLFFTVAPVVIYLLLRLDADMSSFVKVLVGLILAGLTGVYVLQQSLSQGSGVIDETLLTGRWELWTVHFEAFLEEPLFGVGPKLLDRLNVTLGAETEIGLLRSFSENGVFWGSFQLVSILSAGVAGARFIRGYSPADPRRSQQMLFASLVVLTLLPNCVQAHAKVLTMSDLVFWYCVFYVNSWQAATAAARRQAQFTALKPQGQPAKRQLAATG